MGRGRSEKNQTRYLLAVIASLAIIVLILCYIILSQRFIDFLPNLQSLMLQVIPSVVASLLAVVGIYVFFVRKNIDLNPRLSEEIEKIEKVLNKIGPLHKDVSEIKKETKKINQLQLWLDFWADLRGLQKIIMQDKSFKPEVVVSVGRGGAITGGMLAGNLGEIPHLGIDRAHKTRDNERITKIVPFNLEYLHQFLSGKSVLVVMTECLAGRTLPLARDKLKECMKGIGDIKTAVIYRKKDANFYPDYVFKDNETKIVVPFRTLSWRRSSASPIDSISKI